MGAFAHSKRNLGLLATVIGALVLLSILNPHYLSLDNLMVVALQMSFVGITSIGTACLIISGNVDLSIGSMYGVCAVASAMLAKTLPTAAAILAGIIVGGLLGWANGAMVWRVKISPLIITLGTLAVFRGLALRLTNGFEVRDVPPSFSLFGQAQVLGIAMPIVAVILMAVIAHIILDSTTLGRHLYAFGGNREACEAAAINGRRLVLATFAINGLVVGLAAVLAASRFGTASPSFGVGLELDAITAAILGGVAFTGGEGNILGVVLAVLLLAIINSGIISLGIDPHYSQMVKGGVLIVAVVLDQIAHERQETRRRYLAMQERG